MGEKIIEFIKYYFVVDIVFGLYIVIFFFVSVWGGDYD